MLSAFSLFAMGCGTTMPSGYQVTDANANTYEVMWAAIQDINNMCPQIGTILETMYLDGRLSWGDPAPYWYGRSALGTPENPGNIVMEEDYYRYDWNKVSILAEDLIHEAAHSIGGLNDYPGSFTDQYNRSGMHYNDWDLYDYYAGSCPSLNPSGPE